MGAPGVVVPLQPRGEWFTDARDGERAMRVTWHLELGCVVLSTWRDGTCVATTRLTPEEAARLIGLLAGGLAAAVGETAVSPATTGVGARVTTPTLEEPCPTRSSC